MRRNPSKTPGRKPDDPEISEKLLPYLLARFPDECPRLPDINTPAPFEVLALQVARQEGRKDVLALIKTLELKQQKKHRDG